MKSYLIFNCNQVGLKPSTTTVNTYLSSKPNNSISKLIQQLQVKMASKDNISTNVPSKVSTTDTEEYPTEQITTEVPSKVLTPFLMNIQSNTTIAESLITAS